MDGFDGRLIEDVDDRLARQGQRSACCECLGRLTSTEVCSKQDCKVYGMIQMTVRCSMWWVDGMAQADPGLPRPPIFRA